MLMERAERDASGRREVREMHRGMGMLREKKGKVKNTADGCILPFTGQ
jgi:hypothetical protein